MRSFPDLKVAVLSDGSSNLEQNGRFAAEAKAHAANPAKLGLPLPEFAEGLAQVIIVGRITTGKTAHVEVLQHCGNRRIWRAAGVICHRSEFPVASRFARCFAM